MAVATHQNVVHPLVVRILQGTDAVVTLVQDVGSVEGADDDVASATFSHTGHIVAAQPVGMLRIAAKHKNLPAVVTTHPVALRGIPKEALAVLYHLRNPMR